MTRKHFETIAEVFRRNIESFDTQKLDEVTLYLLKRCVQDLAGEFHQFNERFDTDRFINACGLR